MTRQRLRLLLVLLQLIVVAVSQSAIVAEKLVGIHSAGISSQSMPWIAQEAGLLKKHDLEFPLVFIASSAEDLIDRRFLGDVDKSGFIDQLW